MRRVLGVVFVCSLGAAAHAAVDPSVVAAIKKVKASDYPSANTVLVVDTQSVVFQANGQFTNTMHSVTLVLTPEGKAAAADASLYYTKDARRWRCCRPK